MRAHVVSAALALAGCGTISNQPPPELPGPAAEAPQADGEWRWQREHDDGGVHQRETEHWHLTSHGDALSGYYDRRVELRSLDGTPFRCNQATEYVLLTRYFVSGVQDGAQVVLREERHQTVPSPCDRGARRLARYDGTLAPGSLRLRWDGGEQRLERAGEPHAARPLPVLSPVVNGAWTWATERGERSEHEAWVLEERAAGTIAGSYRRTVRDQGCEVVEHYRIHGHRDGARLSLAEVEVRVEPSACEHHQGQRHLDSARAASYGDAIVLEWRGGRRQVLTRQR